MDGSPRLYEKEGGVFISSVLVLLEQSMEADQLMDTFIDLGIPVLKFISIGLTGIFGVIALLVDFKDEDGLITKWGRRALIGVVLSTIVAAATTALENAKGEKESVKTAKAALLQAQKTDKIIQNIDRSLHPLEKLEFAFWAEVSLDANELLPFKKRISKIIENFLSNYQKGVKNKNFKDPFWPNGKVPIGAMAG